MAKKRKRKPSWHPKYWPLHIGFAILSVVARLPYSVKYQIGKLIGLSLYYFNKPMRRVCEINLAHCFPEKTPEQRKKIEIKSFINLGRSFTDAVSLAWMRSPKEFEKMLHSVKGLEHVENALKQGQGVLLLFPHLTNVYMVGYLLMQKLDIPISMMYHSPKNPVIKKFAKERLEKHCDQAFTRRDIKPMLQKLKTGHLVWYAPDLDPGRKSSVFVPFFGVEAATHTATARFVKASNAKAIPIGFYRRKDKSFDIFFHPPLENFPTGNDIIDATTINQALEPIIKKHPEQYLWQYKRFATVADGKKSIYV